MSILYKNVVEGYSDQVYNNFVEKLRFVLKYGAKNEKAGKEKTPISRDVLIYKLEEVTEEYLDIIDSKKITKSNDYLWLYAIRDYIKKLLLKNVEKGSEYDAFINKTLSEIDLLMKGSNKKDSTDRNLSRLVGICRNFLYFFNNRNNKNKNSIVDMSISNVSPNEFLSWIHSENNNKVTKTGKIIIDKIIKSMGFTGGVAAALLILILLPETVYLALSGVGFLAVFGTGGLIGNEIVSSLVEGKSKDKKRNRILYNRFMIMFTLFLYYKYTDDTKKRI